MRTWQIILVLLLIPVIGFVSEFLRMRRKAKYLNLVGEFLEKFINWVDGKGKDYQLYNWLIAKSDLVQTIIGRFGLIHFRAPFNSYSVENYPVILNALPEIRKQFDERFRVGNALSFYIDAVDGCLRRYLGSRGELIKDDIKNFINPVKLFCGGVAWILELPIYFLTECNVISSSRSSRIINGKLFGIFSGLATLVTIIAGIMTIVMGWDNFISAVSSLMKLKAK